MAAVSGNQRGGGAGDLPAGVAARAGDRVRALPRRTGRIATALSSVLSNQAGRRPDGTRSPLVAVAMALPVAVLLAVLFGGWSQFEAQASSVAAMFGR